MLPRPTLVFWILFLKLFSRVITFLSVIEAFDLRDVFFFFFKNHVNIRDKKVMTVILSLSSTMPETSLVVLIFLTGLALVDKLLPIRHVSRKRVNKLIFFEILLFGWSVPLDVLDINFADT